MAGALYVGTSNTDKVRLGSSENGARWEEKGSVRQEGGKERTDVVKRRPNLES